jgi:hypothetical protein
MYIVLHQKRKQCLEFALPKLGEICKPKLGEICKHLAVLTVQTVMPVGYTILLLSAENKVGKINTMGRVFLRKNVPEKLSIINPL